MSTEEFEQVQRQIRIRQRCMQEDRIALGMAQQDVRRFETAIAEDQRQISDFEEQINAHWRAVFDLPEVQA